MGFRQITHTIAHARTCSHEWEEEEALERPQAIRRNFLSTLPSPPHNKAAQLCFFFAPVEGGGRWYKKGVNEFLPFSPLAFFAS